MKAIVCEMCGSQDLVKQEGLYICQNCGTKYSVEEARKLIGTVKIDNSDEIEKFLILARRGREENNSENAVKYYGAVLQDNPNNWEASFFLVYYQSMQTKIANIENAASRLANCINNTFELINLLETEEEKDNALSVVLSYSNSIALMLANAAQNHYRKHINATGTKVECDFRIIAIEKIYTSLENALKEIYPNKEKLLYGLLNAYLHFIQMYKDNISKEWLQKESVRLSSEIKVLGADASFKYVCGNPVSKDEYANIVNMAKETKVAAIKYISTTYKTSLNEAKYFVDSVLTEGKGDERTENTTKTVENKGKSGCYVATAVYGSYDCPQVWTLRRYRDYRLAKSWYGRTFIRVYYAISPTLVKWFGKTKLFNRLWKGQLDKMVDKLQKEGYSDCPYEDINW